MKNALLCVATLALSAAAQAAPPGTLYITVDPVDTSQAGFEQTLKKLNVKELAAKSDQWSFSFVAYLKKATGSRELTVAFYDNAVKGHEPTNVIPVSTQTGAKVLASTVSFGPDQGFKPGHSYTVLITRLVGGKEDVYARSSLTLH